MKEELKDLSVAFEVVIKEVDGKFIGECRELAGLVVSGANRNEVIKNMRAAIPLYLRYVPKESFIPVYENKITPIIYDFEEFNGHMYACTNKDSVIRTATGDVGAWESISISNIFSPYFNPPVGQTRNFEEEPLGDYTPQVYCLKAFNDLGTPKLYCGTNATGGIYETLDGKNWSLSFNSGEARIHCLESFKGRLFAGTSTEGKIYAYNGTHWVISLNTAELAINSFGVYRDYLYAGTYPNGIIYRTADGINWQKVFDTNQSFINDFEVYKNRLYVSTSKASGGLIFMTEDGTNWVENFFSEKDVNFYSFALFSNSLYAGSGDNGRIYKTIDGKKWELVFQTDEEDVRSLFVFNGYLYFGSSPKGRIFKTTISNTPPPKVFDAAVAEITSHSAVITWKTDREASTIIEYGLDKTYGNNIINEVKTASHRITLNNLKAMTEYHFRILTYSDVGSFSGILEDYKFTTSAAITPVITSATHPDQSKWYNMADAQVFWGLHPDVKQYLYVIDAAPETKPDPASCQASISDGVTIKNLEDGTWYLHLLIEDKAGNISSTVSHFKLNVDTSALPPALSSPTHPEDTRWYSDSSPVFQLTEPKDLSGISGYYYIVDDLPNTLPNERTGKFIKDLTLKINQLEDGVKYLHVVSKDKAGNTGTKASHCRVNIDTHALPPVVSSPTHTDEELWYPQKKAQLHLGKPHDMSGIEGFYYCVDVSPKTEPRDPEAVYTTSGDISLPERADGTWYIHVKSKDKAGNISKETTHFKLRIDTLALPPNVSSITHPDPHKWYNVKKAQFRIDAPDDLSGIEGWYYAIDNSAKSVPDTSSTWIDKDTLFSGDLADGEWYIHAISKDKAGNVGTSASHYRFNIDTQALPPKVYSKTHKDQEEWYNNSIPELHWDTPADLSGIEGYYYIVDSKYNTVPTKETGEWIKTNQLTLPQLEDGTWYFHITSKDNAGNVGWEAEHFKLKIDTRVDAPKVTSITHPDENRWYNSPEVKIAWTVPQDLSKIKNFYTLLSKEKFMKLDTGSALKTDKREEDYRITEEGTYYFHIVGEDNAGNVGEEPAIYTVHVDLKAEPPELISTTHPGHERFYSNTHPVFVVDRVEDLSGVDGYYYLVDRNPDTLPDKKNAKFTKDGTVKISEKLDDGEWYFHIILKDNAGNTGKEAAHYKFKIETCAPEVFIKEMPEFTAAESFNVEWEGSDKDSGVFCFTVEYREGDKGKWKNWVTEAKSKNAAFKGEDGITYYFRIKARDNAGNWSEFVEDERIKTTIDISAPSPVTQIVARPSAFGAVALEWNKCQDPVSGFAFYRIYRSSTSGHLGMQINDDNSTLDAKFTDTAKELEDGIIYYYTVRAVDRVGNERESGNKQVMAICDRMALPPVVRSSTHPMQESWYNHKNIRLSWDTPQDATRITGYYYIFDQTAVTMPDAKTGTWYTDNELDLPNTGDGTWYLHIISKDEAGNISDEASHFRINIDTTKPKPPVISSITHQDFNRWYNNNSPTFSWTTPPDQAGIEGYYYVFNQMRESKPDIAVASWTKGTMASFVDVPDGTWYLHVLAKDTAGNISEDASHMQANVAMTPPPPQVFSPSHEDQERWYRDKNVKLVWKPAAYVNDIIGYYYTLDNSEKTVPTPKNNKTMDTSIAFTGLNDGQYYFHIVSVDREGVIGKTVAHFRIKIKSKITMRGTVTQSNGVMPLAGAAIEVTKDDGTLLAAGISGKDGNYVIENLTVGRVRVKVSAKNLPPQLISQVELREEESEKMLNISTEIFAMYDPAQEIMTFNYFIPEDGLVSIKFYSEAGKIINTIDEKKKGKIYNNTVMEVKGIEPGTYLYQVQSKGDVTAKITKYGIRKIKIEKN